MQNTCWHQWKLQSVRHNAHWEGGLNQWAKDWNQFQRLFLPILSCSQPSLSSSLLVYCHVTISLSSLHQHLCLAQIIFKWPQNGSFDSLDFPCLSCFLVNVIMHVLSHLYPSCLVPITPCHVIMLRHLFESLFVIYSFNEIIN